MKKLKGQGPMKEKIEKAINMIQGAQRVVVFTGAGVSTESGIPDFRSPGGLWTRFDPDDFTIDKYLRSEETRRKMWKILIGEGLLSEAEPNPAHKAVAELERLGKLRCVITQNIDNLHQKGGNSPEKVYELHGNMKWVICLKCRNRMAMDAIRQKAASEEFSPVCEYCGGLLKPDVIFFGEMLPQDTLRKASRESEQCDLFLVIGSSLVVYPAASLPLQAKRAGAELIIVNLGPTEQDHLADVIINDYAGETMSAIVMGLEGEEKQFPN
jgi:NAD-dependent deacetylase